MSSRAKRGDILRGRCKNNHHDHLNNNLEADSMLDEEGVLVVEAILEIDRLTVLGNEDGLDVGELGLAALAGLIGIEHDFDLLGVSDELDKLHEVLSLANDEGVDDEWIVLVDLKEKLEDLDLLFLLSDISGEVDIAFSLWWKLFWGLVMNDGWFGSNSSWLSVLDCKTNVGVLILLDFDASIAFAGKDTGAFHDM